MKRILLTGATGFVGRNLVPHLLRNGFAVEVLVRPDSNPSVLGSFARDVRVHRYLGDYESAEKALLESKPDVLVHLATHFVARHKPSDISSLIQSNVLFGAHLLEAMGKAGTKFYLDAGTFWQHFGGEDYHPSALYAATKQALRDVLKFYVEAAGIRALTLELFETYGPGDTRAKVLNLFMNRSREGVALPLSPGEQELDLVHVADVCRAFETALSLLLNDRSDNKMPVYSVSSGAPITLKDLGTRIEAVTGKKGFFRFGELPYRDREIFKATSPVPALPNWSPRISLEAGLKEVWAALGPTN